MGIAYEVAAHLGLVDRLSGPAEKVAGAAGRVATQMTAAQRAAHVLNNTSAGLGRVYDTARVKVSGFTSSLLVQVGAIAGITATTRGLYQAVVDGNLEWERSAIAIGGMASALTTLVRVQDPIERFGKSLAAGNDMLRRFEEMEGRVAIGMEQLVPVGEALSIPILQAGKSMADVAKWTEKVSLAARALGENAGGMAMRITQAVEVGMVPRMGKMAAVFASLRGKLQDMSRAERLEAVGKVLDKWAAAGKLAITDWDRAMFEIKDTMGDLLRDAGRPVFKAVTAELHRWAEWLSKNKEHVERMASKLAGVVVSSARTLATIVAAIAEHWRLIATVYVGSKLISGLQVAIGLATKLAAINAAGAVVGGVAGGASGAAGAAGAAAGGAGASAGTAGRLGLLGLLGKWAGAVVGGSAAAIGGAIGVGLLGVGGAFTHQAGEDERERVNREMGRIDATRGQAAVESMAIIERMKAKLEGLHLDLAKTPMSATGQFGQIELAVSSATAEILRQYSKLAADAQLAVRDSLVRLGVLQTEPSVLGIETEAYKKGKKAEVHIDKVEVKQDFRDQDPDRVYVRLIESLQGISEAALSSPVLAPLGGERLM